MGQSQFYMNHNQIRRISSNQYQSTDLVDSFSIGLLDRTPSKVNIALHFYYEKYMKNLPFIFLPQAILSPLSLLSFSFSF